MAPKISQLLPVHTTPTLFEGQVTPAKLGVVERARATKPALIKRICFFFTLAPTFVYLLLLN